MNESFPATLKHYLSVAFFSMKLSVQHQLEYPLFLVSWFLLIPMQYFAGIWMLDIIVDRFQPLQGWAFPQLAFLFGLGLLSHGLKTMFFIQAHFIDHWVTQGEYDRLLLRPMNVFYQFMVGNVNLIGLLDLLPGAVVFFYACHLVQFDWSLFNIIKLLLVIIGATLIRGAVYTALGSIAFWTMRSRPLIGMTEVLMERTTMYPLTIYPVAAQIVLTFVLPIGFISFYPAGDFLSQDGLFRLPLEFALWTPLVGVVSFGLMHQMFKKGIQRYESTGS